MRKYYQDKFDWSPKTTNQHKLKDMIKRKRVVLATGPAGTGKTFITVCCAFEELLSGRVNGLVICRPLVPAGREFGFLPGTLADKIKPFLDPLLDAMLDLNLPSIQRLLEGEDSPIECLPLELMRGRTFTEKFIIVDEAQNTTPNQVEMAMTRIGKDSRMVFCGDTYQTDIRGTNGLAVALKLFEHEDQFGIVKFGLEDIQREGIVRTVIERFQSYFGRL